MSTQKRPYQLRARAESQRATRERIAAAAAALHEEQGIAGTTVADIARRAGVQRLTVYNHFPDLRALLPACSAHWIAQHPPPDLLAGLSREDPPERVRAVLADLYSWYRETERMQERIMGERASVPELDELMEEWDAEVARLVDALAAGFAARGKRRRDLRAALAVALEFWTWRRLARSGLGDRAAAALMARASAAAAGLAPDLHAAAGAERIGS